jgi:hypothetical protein
MPIIEQTTEQRELERVEEIEDREWAADREEARQRHQLELAKTKLAVPQRHKTIARIGIALAKSPALLILAIMLPVLILCGKEVPQPLADFLIL